jgi:outer membrane protein assembly factor BamB
MMTTLARTALALTAVLYVADVPAAGEAVPDGLSASPEPGWPQWRGPRRDGVSEEKGLLPRWPEQGPKLLWKIGALGRGWSSPIVTGGTVYVTGEAGGDLVIHALDLDGQPKWQAKNGAAWNDSWPGARSCCAYSEGRLYHLNAHGRVAALDAATGKELWAVEVLKRFESPTPTWAMSENLLVDGPRLIVTPAGPKTLVAALDKLTGETVWMSEPVRGEVAAYSSPILFARDGRRVLAGCSSHHGFGVDADTGKLLWTVPLRNPYGATVMTPIYGDGGVFYAATDGPEGVCYRITTEARAELLWKTPVATLTGSGVLVDGSLYAVGCKKAKSLHRVDWKSGQTRYEVKLTAGDTPWAAGAFVWADGRLYGLAEDGSVHLLEPKAEAFEAAGRFQLVPGRVRDAWAHPVLLDGRLYLRYHDSLWCYDVRGK